MAFNFLSKLDNRPENTGEDDEGSPVDDVDEEIWEESDVECDGEEDNETSIDSRPSTQLSRNLRKMKPRGSRGPRRSPCRVDAP